MSSIPGTKGYDESISLFIDASQKLNFQEVCKDFLDYLPARPSRVLDAGAGVGQNSAALAEMGHSVVAIEPVAQFISTARNSFRHPQISWLQDSLPMLRRLDSKTQRFEFILVDGVWHHLDEAERASALKRLISLLDSGGRCALSLRNGPPGIGTHVFPTDAETTIQQARELGMQCVFRAENLKSIFPQKENVTWARIVLQKQ